MFFPLYLRMWNNTVMILFSKTELHASKQYYFLMSLLSLFVYSAGLMFSGWGKGPSATWVFTCFHLYPLSSVNTIEIGGTQQKHNTARTNYFWINSSLVQPQSRYTVFLCSMYHLMLSRWLSLYCSGWCDPLLLYTSMTEGAGGVEGDFEGQARGGKWDIGSISAG